jgi:hypothetical protein
VAETADRNPSLFVDEARLALHGREFVLAKANRPTALRHRERGVAGGFSMTRSGGSWLSLLEEIPAGAGRLVR